jgi:hypothetical protein
MLLISTATLALGGTASADPLWDAELRLGYGFAMASGDGMTSPRSAPLTVEVLAAVAIQDEPKLFGYGGFVVETLDRNSIGGSAGVQLAQGSIRARIGGVYLFAPYSLWGASASAGTCTRLSTSLRGCADLQLTEYFAGTDLVPGHAVTQVQLVFGMVIDGT